jgi:hypothetical protein
VGTKLILDILGNYLSFADSWGRGKTLIINEFCNVFNKSHNFDPFHALLDQFSAALFLTNLI